MASPKTKALKEYERRSQVDPATPQDKKLGLKHLKDSIEFNERHARDHEKLMKQDEQKMKNCKSKAVKKKLKESEHYNADHAKKHEKNAEEDREELHERSNQK